MSLTFAIADLHGRFDLLDEAYERIGRRGRNPEQDRIVALGDYVDRGPESRQVITFLMALQAKDANVICLRGNHEEIMVVTCVQKKRPDWWISNGGAATLYSYGHPKLRASNYGSDVHTGFVLPEHLKWAGALPLYHEDEHRVYVHAGVPDNRPMEKHHSDSLTWMLYSKDNHGGYNGKHVVHGHHQFEDGPKMYLGRTNLDTAAYKTGRLVVGVFDDDRPGGAVDFIEVRG